MRLLYQEIPAVSKGRARADLRVLVLQTLSHDHVEDRKRRSLAAMRAVVLRAARTTGAMATKATKTNNPDADYNPNKKSPQQQQ